MDKEGIEYLDEHARRLLALDRALQIERARFDSAIRQNSMRSSLGETVSPYMLSYPALERACSFGANVLRTTVARSVLHGAKKWHSHRLQSALGHTVSKEQTNLVVEASETIQEIVR